MQSSHPQMSLVSPCFCSPSMAPCYCSDCVSCPTGPSSPLPFYRWTWPPQRTYGSTPPLSPALFCPLLPSSPSLSFHGMAIAQQSFHKWDSLTPSSQGWVCTSGCSTPLELWRRVRCLVEMLGIYTGKALKCLEVSFWWLNTHAQRMVGKIQKYLLISVEGITGNAACYMPWCSLYMLHASCMLSSDFSINSVQFKKITKLLGSKY